ncbi:MAG: Na(+)-translocating NADH-quinone reductase subunit A [Planctomycetes bacterium]|nr:Na(+)-translocating NADH-quinone reductase subunit A [Planctomycetota bacterium]
MTTHKITKGFDLRLAGAPARTLVDAPEPSHVAVGTAEFSGIKPKVLVKEGDDVVTGQPIFLDKVDRDVVFCSPATGRVTSIEYGERRFLRRVVIENAAAFGKADAEKFADARMPASDRASLRKAIKNAGLWHLFVQRPIGKMPRGDQAPVAIFVNGMDTAPLAADPAFAVAGCKGALQRGIDLLQQLTDGPIHLSLHAAGPDQSDLRDLRDVEVHDFAGPHPAGLTGTHISRLQPLKSGEIAYCLRLQDLVRLGSWAETGRYPAQTVIAMSGSAAPARQYYRIRHGAPVSSLNGGAAIGGDVRVIDGNVLAGRAIAADGELGFRTTTLTVIPEGTDQRDLFGWAVPAFGKLSRSRSVFSWLSPKKEYVVDARLNGGQRPIVNIGAWDEVTPLDIYPSYLLRAIQCGDLEEAIKLGLLEVTEEDVALCTFVDASKIDVGSVIRSGLDLYEKEG